MFNLNRLIRGMRYRDGELTAYGLEVGALLIIIGVATLFIGLLMFREVRKVNSIGIQNADLRS
ncbi:hypothetical protein [Paenibacillus thalictri]|uniref:hypothetical protein n=1 Tax=Paenibacillus thalictri TaxID=2527873 RepID=UPI00197EFE9F|nr:hypothetical protein [Paenibacillus thalictri]